MTKRRRVFVGAMNGLLVGLFITTVAATSAVLRAEIVDAEDGHRPATPQVEWSDKLAARFPGCAAGIPRGVIPTAVIEVRGGFPVRVDFDDAWERTHDGDLGNHGDVIGVCASPNELLRPE